MDTNIKVGMVQITLPPLQHRQTGVMVTEATNERDRAGGRVQAEMNL